MGVTFILLLDRILPSHFFHDAAKQTLSVWLCRGRTVCCCIKSFDVWARMGGQEIFRGGYLHWTSRDLSRAKKFFLRSSTAEKIGTKNGAHSRRPKVSPCRAGGGPICGPDKMLPIQRILRTDLRTGRAEFHTWECKELSPMAPSQQETPSLPPSTPVIPSQSFGKPPGKMRDRNHFSWNQNSFKRSFEVDIDTDRTRRSERGRELEYRQLPRRSRRPPNNVSNRDTLRRVSRLEALLDLLLSHSSLPEQLACLPRCRVSAGGQESQ